VRVDLNADLGESYGAWTLGDDAALLPLITSANVACGFHAGDPATLRRTCESAVAAGVVIGAQVSYPDLAGFGRRFLDIAADDLTAAVIYQIGALDGLARAAGSRVRYVKPHGALYNAIVTHEAQADAVVAAVRAYDADLPVVGLPGSTLLHRAAAAGLTTIAEAFADRAYQADGSLVPRSQSGALLSDPAVIAAQAAGLVRARAARTLCVHGDTPGAAQIAVAVRAALVDAGFELVAFA
jgi:5-oxoprolinase (ATP-hydrolysing) subunit A